MRMQTMVEKLYQYRKRGEQGGPSHVEGIKEGGVEEPPKNPPSSPSYLDGSLHSPFEKKNKLDGKIDFNVSQLKIDIKFELPIYKGELNAEKLDHWIHQIKFYCRIKKFPKYSIISNLRDCFHLVGEQISRGSCHKRKNNLLLV